MDHASSDTFGMNDSGTCLESDTWLTQDRSRRVRAGLIAQRVHYGPYTPAGHRCSNLAEINDNLFGATGEQRRNLLASMARQAAELEELAKAAVPAKAHRNIETLDLERLREVLDYDPETGALTWRVVLSPICKVGDRAGVIKSHGYRKISIDGRNYTASNLAWFHYYGEPPARLIDHEDRDKSNDRIGNLRLATSSQNSQNIGRNSANTTGFKGVAVFNTPGQPTRYRTLIRVNGERIFLGIFDTPEEAHEVYCKAAEKHHGEFARTE